MTESSFPPPSLQLVCGDSGTMTVKVIVSEESDQNEANFQKISDKWSELWPKVYECVSEMRRKYKYPPAINAPDAHLKFILPDDPVDSNGTWEVAITVDSDGAGEWSVAFSGWDIVPEDSQPFF